MMFGRLHALQLMMYLTYDGLIRIYPIVSQGESICHAHSSFTLKEFNVHLSSDL